MHDTSLEKRYTYQEYLSRFSRPSGDKGRERRAKAEPEPKEVGREMARAIIGRLLAT